MGCVLDVHGRAVAVPVAGRQVEVMDEFFGMDVLEFDEGMER